MQSKTPNAILLPVSNLVSVFNLAARVLSVVIINLAFGVPFAHSVLLLLLALLNIQTRNKMLSISNNKFLLLMAF